MTEVDRNRAVVLEQHAQVWSRSDPDAVSRYFAADVACHVGGRALRGREAIQAMIRSRGEAFPDWSEAVEIVIAEGDLVASRVISTATHTGPFHGVAASGARIRIGEMFIYRLRDGLIAECWAELDMLGLMTQIRGPRA